MRTLSLFVAALCLACVAACSGESAGGLVFQDASVEDAPFIAEDSGASGRDVQADKVVGRDEGGQSADGAPSPDLAGLCDPPAAAWCPCQGNQDCASGWCVTTLDGKVCTTTCFSDEQCPDGLTCEQIPWVLPDVLYLCVQTMSLVCRPCEDHDDCRSDFRTEDDRCLDFGPDGRYCGLDCSAGQRCPSGYTCREIAQGAETLFQCQPEDGACGCLPQFEGMSTPCSRENGGLTCLGERICEEGVYSDCDAPVPQEEDCNGLDDDCDGLTDEELGSESCGLGVCRHEVQSCQAGEWVDCDPFEGQSAEICDGRDNDCDGSTDEEWSGLGEPCDGPDRDFCERGLLVCASDGSGTTCENDEPETLEVCNAADDDCDGLTDEVEDLGETTCGFGVCRKTVPNCVDGQPRLCDPMAEASDEICDGLDNDCDGATDEELGSTTCGLGSCLHTVPNCLEGQPQVCDPLEGQRRERCDGLDDDCDGETDEDWPDKGLPCDGPDADLCARGVLVCGSGGASLICEGDEPESLESCNGLDDDCDGETDEVADLGETTCGVGLCLKTVPNCLDGEPNLCDPLLGAEPSDEPDGDAIDSNCDGVDGDLARAWFVSRQAAPGGDGSREQPFRTIAQALAAAAGDPVRDQILIAGGTFYEQITLVDGVGLFGGYDGATWQRDIGAQETVLLWQDVDGLGAVRTVLAEGIVNPTTVQGLTIRSGAHPSNGGSSYAVWARDCTDALRFELCEIRAGAGNRGADGVLRSQAASGTPGNASENGDPDTTCLGVEGDPSGQGGGGGGNGVCPGTTSGGKGGDAGCGCHILTDSNGGASGGGGAAGGGAGDCNGNGGQGAPGAAGSAGSDGVGSSGGALDAQDLWAGAGGSDGGDGTAGTGGGGGGGGGGDCLGFCEFGVGLGFGGGGGGGGGGGCGGLGGDGGQAGGGSFALFLVDSSPSVARCLIQTGSGGAGGAGAVGGLGGVGGLGSGGGNGSGGGGDGGAGGRGGDGGRGGNGGGGAGGPSVGIFAHGSSAPACESLSFVLAAPGTAGTPGGGAGQQANVWPTVPSCSY